MPYLLIFFSFNENSMIFYQTGTIPQTIILNPFGIQMNSFMQKILFSLKKP